MKSKVRILARLFLLFLITIPMVGLIAACSALFPGKQTTDERLGRFPEVGLPLEQPVKIYWNDYQVPFIEAESDRDAAVAMGMVHAHLRGTQISLLRSVSQGRLSEIAGGFATGIDQALRRLDFVHAARQTRKKLPPETLAWIEAYVEGINAYFANASQRPPEFALMGSRPEPFTVDDILAIAKLAGTDVNWLGYFRMLRERDRPDFDKKFAEEVTHGLRSPISTSTDDEQVQHLEQILAGLSKSGSNSFAVGPDRTETGAAMMANDPHLGINQPNIWMIMGVKSPSYHWVGMTLPGVPVCAFGRNEHLSWGGTNMRAASSNLYDVSGIPRDQIEEEKQTIRVRFWRDQETTVRRSPLGPIISDAELIPAKEGEEIALRWTGYNEDSDEIGAFLKANRASSAEEFRAAFENYAISGQNLLFATNEGDIGMILAVWLPVRGYERPPALVLDPDNPDHLWTETLSAVDLPWILNPPEGYVASANNRTLDLPVPIGYFFNVGERIERIREMLEADDNISREDLVEMQRDTKSLASIELRDNILAIYGELAFQPEHPIAGALRDWDGFYAVDSAGAIAFELTLYHLVDQVRATGRAVSDEWSALVYDFPRILRQLTLDEQTNVFSKALPAAAKDWKKYPTWGDFHSIEVKHMLSTLPLVGARFRYDQYPVGGSRETVFKRAHGLSREPQATFYGSQSRHISLMHDVDENYFVLFGGQDGWLGSENFLDQIDMWRKGEFMKVPLRLEAIRESFTRTTTLLPDDTSSLNFGES